MSLTYKGKEDLLTKSKLILGGGVGWTGSLGLDLLINTFELEKIGSFLSSVLFFFLWHFPNVNFNIFIQKFHNPMAGSGVFSHESAESLTTTVDGFFSISQPKKYKKI